MAFDKLPHFEIPAVRVMGKLRDCWLHTDAKWSSNHFVEIHLTATSFSLVSQSISFTYRKIFLIAVPVRRE